MTLGERRARTSLVIVALVTGTYLTGFAIAAARMPVDRVPYQGGLLLTALVLLGVLAVTSVATRRSTDPEDRGHDERDRQIWLRSAATAYRWVGFLLPTVMVLASQRVSTVWIVQAVYATIAIGMVVQCGTAARLYRRG